MRFTLSVSTELMTNFRRADVLRQSGKFFAAHGLDGHAAFIGIGDDGNLALIAQRSGGAEAWQAQDLTAGLPGKAVRFAAAQSDETGALDLVVAMEDDGGAQALHVALDLGTGALAGGAATASTELAWEALPDDRGADAPPLRVVEIHAAAGIAGADHFIVDAEDAHGMIDRWCVDAAPAPAARWEHHPLAFDIAAAAGDRSAVGRKAGEEIDGIYTLGDLRAPDEDAPGIPQLVYTPFRNLYAPGTPPNPTGFDLGGLGVSAGGIAFDTCPAAPEPAAAPDPSVPPWAQPAAGAAPARATDLFIAGGGRLMLIPAQDQRHGAAPVTLLEDPLFTDMRELHAASRDGTVAVWGLCAAGKVFYATCPADALLRPEAWSPPLPILSGVTSLSQYIDPADGALTLFGLAGGVIRQGVRDPQTGRWIFSQVELPATDPDTPAQRGMSYVTSFHICDAQDRPLPHAEAQLSADGRAAVIVNGVHHAMTGAPVTVQADETGAVTVVEWVEGLSGATFTLEKDGARIEDAAHDHALRKMRGRDSVAALEGWVQPLPDGGERRLLPEGLSAEAKETLALSVRHLNHAHARLTGEPDAPAVTLGTGRRPDYVEALWSDVVHAIEHVAEAAVEFIHDAAEEALHLVLRYGGKVIGFVVDAAHKACAALETVWKAVTKGAKDLWAALCFVFNWGDIVRTKNVFKKTFMLSLEGYVEQIDDLRKNIVGGLTDAQDRIRAFEHENAFPPGRMPAFETLAPKAGHDVHDRSAPTQLLRRHVHEGAPHMRVFPPAGGLSPTIDGTPLKDEAHPLTNLSERMKILEDLDHWEEELGEAFSTLVAHFKRLIAAPDLDGMLHEIESILRIILGEIGIAVIEVFKTVVDALLMFIEWMMETAIATLDAPIRFGVLTDFLEEHFGIKAFSVLDIATIVPAALATIRFKTINDHAPFEDGEGTLYRKILSARTRKELRENFGTDKTLITPEPDEKQTLFQIYALAALYLTGIKEAFGTARLFARGATDARLKMAASYVGYASKIELWGGSLFSLSEGIKDKEMASHSKTAAQLGGLSELALFVAPLRMQGYAGMMAPASATADPGKLSAYTSALTGAIVAGVTMPAQVVQLLEASGDVEPNPDNRHLEMAAAAEGLTSGFGSILGLVGMLDLEPVTLTMITTTKVALNAPRSAAALMKIDAADA